MDDCAALPSNHYSCENSFSAGTCNSIENLQTQLNGGHQAPAIHTQIPSTLVCKQGILSNVVGGGTVLTAWPEVLCLNLGDTHKC